jgi:hypothetical protein
MDELRRVYSYKDGTGGSYQTQAVGAQTWKYGFVLEEKQRKLVVTFTRDRGETWETEESSPAHWSNIIHPFEVRLVMH